MAQERLVAVVKIITEYNGSKKGKLQAFFNVLLHFTFYKHERPKPVIMRLNYDNLFEDKS